MRGIDEILLAISQHPNFGKFIQTGEVTVSAPGLEDVTQVVSFPESFADDNVAIILQPTNSALPNAFSPHIPYGLKSINKNSFSVVAHNSGIFSSSFIFNWTAFGKRDYGGTLEGMDTLNSVLYTFRDSFANTGLNFYNKTYTGTNNEDITVPSAKSGTTPGLVVGHDYGDWYNKHITATQQSNTTVRLNTYNQSGVTTTTNARLAYIFKPTQASHDSKININDYASLEDIDKIFMLLAKKWMKVGIQGGSIDLTTASDATTINFPVPFKSPPIVRLHKNNHGMHGGEGDVTETGFTPTDLGTESFYGSWVAIGEYD